MPLRDYAVSVLPPWLLDKYGTAWARAHGSVKDGLAALLKERVAASLPIRPGAGELAPYAPAGALEAIGRDVLMPRAIGEADAGYASRLAGAWEAHAEGGTPRGALRALMRTGYPHAMLVIRSQRLYRLDGNGELVVEMLPAGSWAFEPEPQAFWSRYALLFAAPNLPAAWTAPVVRTLGPRVAIQPNGTAPGSIVLSTPWYRAGSGAPMPTVSFTGGPVPTYMYTPLRTIVLTVVDPTPDNSFLWYMEGSVSQGHFSGTPSGEPLLDHWSTGEYSEIPTPTGIQVAFPAGVYEADDEWQFDVYKAPDFPAASTPPTLAQTGTLAFAGPVTVSVAAGDPDYTFTYSVAGAAPRTVAMTRGTPVALLLADNSPSGVSITWNNVSTHYPGATWQWTVTAAYPVPAEDSVEVNLLRTLTKEWSNAAAVFQGITVVSAGGCWGYPLGTWGEPGDYWGGDVVTNYHG